MAERGRGVIDIVERLRNWRTVHLTQLRYLMESSADEIERLRGAANSTPDLRSGCGECLTDAEREAVEQAIDAANGMILAEPWAIETLRALLARLSPPAT
jgi:hypothetical protein